MAASLKHLKIAPKDAHTATVIFLHVRHDPSSIDQSADIRVSETLVRLLPTCGWPSPVAFAHIAGHGWLPVAKMLWSSFPNVKWILPHAPEIPITINGGESVIHSPMQAWIRPPRHRSGLAWVRY